jgi:uncharacterized protein YbaA (DUF1428 family)
MKYVDGFVIPVKKRDLASYRKMAQWGRRLWMRHGALDYYECQGDELGPMPWCGSFKQMARLRAGETVFFSFIIYRSKAHRNAVNKRVMSEMEQQAAGQKMPFNPKRMAYAGFKAVVTNR